MKAKKIVIYYAGVVNSHLEIKLSDEHIGFQWIDVRSHRRVITYERDQYAVENALKWLQEYTHAAIKLSINLEKLGY